MNTANFLITRKTSSPDTFILAKDLEELTTFQVKSEGFSNLVDLFYEKKITLEDFGTATRLVETSRQIPLYTEGDVEKGIAHMMAEQTMIDTFFNINLFSILTIAKQVSSFPSFFQSRHSKGAYTFLLIKEPVLEKIDGVYKFSPLMSTALYTVLDCINAVYLFYNKSNITSNQKDLLLKQIETLIFNLSAPEVKN